MRYRVNGTQVEKSFKDSTHPDSGRVSYGSGKQNFGEACEQLIDRMRVNENTRGLYLGAYRTYVQRMFGDKTLTQVAQDRDGVTELLTMTMKHLSNSPRQQTRMLIVGTCDEAVRAGRLARHNLAGIELADHGPKNLHADFVFPAYAQVKFVADGGVNPKSTQAIGGAGICVWLMRGCGLRIEEALAVCKVDFITRHSLGSSTPDLHQRSVPSGWLVANWRYLTKVPQPKNAVRSACAGRSNDEPSADMPITNRHAQGTHYGQTRHVHRRSPSVLWPNSAAVLAVAGSMPSIVV